MTLPDRSIIESTHGYHPIAGDAADLARTKLFSEMLVLGTVVPDVHALVANIRHLIAAPAPLPEGLYWFSGISPSAVLVVTGGAPPGAPLREQSGAVPEGSALDQALSWFDHLWDGAPAVERPSFEVLEEVVTRGSGMDGLIKARQYLQGRWIYSVFTGGRTQKMAEDALMRRPMLDSPDAWVRTPPVPADRFAATLTRAKLEGRFTDTVFSFRATRTIFRPYQFKPVMKLLGSGSLRMLIADEVGLGKTIEAGLLWTELEARRRADRVLVVCPSGLTAKWQREMEERFGFELHELTSSALADIRTRVEGNRLPKRAGYVCSVERLRKWDGLADVTTLGLQFDLVIVDEAHVFRNSSTKSHALGEHLSQWADALVFLSATPVNLRNQDLFNLLELLVPGEFQDLEGLHERIEPNAVLHKITASLLDRSVGNDKRRQWLEGLTSSAFGRVLTLRPDFALLRETLARPDLTPADVVQVKRVCSELHGLASQITRTRKVEVQEDKAVREARPVSVEWSQEEHDFYQAFYRWCVERAKAKAMPLNFAMQMPLRLAGSCLPEAADYVRTWTGAGVRDEVDSALGRRTVPRGPDVAPSAELVALAAGLDVDAKLEQFNAVVGGLLDQGRQALVFTFSRRTLAYLEGHLRGRCRVGVLHGGVPKESRDRIMADFRAGGYDIVVATKVASEGLDFEFCSVLINYDLPWNPMEIEQRIGRIDRIGQREAKIIIINFTTPGTIESEILERVLDRIGVFEHAIGALEPIIESAWGEVEAALMDFALSPEQREQRALELLAALAEQERALGEVESAAPYLISSDGVDIEGLEPDLVASGRYIGQAELALLVADWVKTYGGRSEIADDLLTVVGNSELAGHVMALVRLGVRTSAEVDAVHSSLRNEQPLHLSLNQEESRLGGIPLLAATHPLVRAALGVPGHRQSRFSSVVMSRREAGVPVGRYLVQLCVAHWDGIRPLHEVWTATADAVTGGLVPDLGDRLMGALALGRLSSGGLPGDLDLQAAVSATADALLGRLIAREGEMQSENTAFMATRRLSAEQVHARRIDSINDRINTLRLRGRYRMIPLFDAQLRRERARFASFNDDMNVKSHAALTTEDLAVCLVEVTE
ncbi:DEAD/DEAH box helicase [Pedococcus bigeumensis]|uniref:DEAD/DEAH box helicase n=1 Tax=Pedococcus bigeumensis TaxID=433644 RepID=UPI0031DD70E2